MKKLNLTLLLLLFVSIAFGQKSLLWKISGKDLNEPSYLYGTIHLICPDEFFLLGSVKRSLSECKELVLEVDLTQPEMMQKLQVGMMNPKMKNIESDLSEKDVKELDAALNGVLGVGIDQMGILKPWALSSMLAVLLSSECEQPVNYETKLSKLATEGNLTVAGLETVEEQLAVFENIPYEEQLEWLMETVRDKEKSKLELQKMVKYYKEQDIDNLYKYILEQDDMKRFKAVLLDNRNKNWVVDLAERMKSKSCFIAVGAGHLPGPTGVIQLLKDQGYNVQPVY